MHPHITNIVMLLQQDFAVLRRNLGKEYEELVEAQKRFIQNNATSMDAGARRQEIRAIGNMMVEMKQADTTFAAMQKSLGSLEAAHAKLPSAFESKGRIPLDESIANAIEEGRRVKKFYESLDAK
jgi:hypothetical protein